MEVTFYIRKELINQKGYAPLRMHITVDGSLIKKSIKEISIKPKDWKADKQRVRTNNKNEEYNNHSDYNQILEELTEKVRNIERHALINKIALTKEYVLSKLDEKTSISIEHSFFDLFQTYIDQCRLVNTPWTIKGYNTVLKFLKDFSRDTGYVFILDTIDINTFEELRKYSFDTRNTRNNYFAKIVNVLKRFMEWAYKHKYHKNREFKDFKVSEHEIEVIFLEKEELFKLYEHQFESSKLEKVKDSFCFACFTGLRFSDLSNLQTSNIFTESIKLDIRKTKETDHIIPLNKFSKSILEKYKGTIHEPLPIISSQKFNDYLKECCKEAGIDKPVTITRFIGSRRIEITEPKYEFITSHTARKTFATNSLILGMSERAVRGITGHKKEESFRRYVKISSEFQKKQMEDTWDKI